MELYVLTTVLAHLLLAMLVGAHAEVYGRRHWRWAPIVFLTGIFGVLWYAVSDPPEGDAPTSPLSAADPPAELLEQRPREKRLTDPNTLHLDLPDGTTLTGTEQAAVGAVVERLDGQVGEPGEDARENVFEEQVGEPGEDARENVFEEQVGEPGEDARENVFEEQVGEPGEDARVGGPGAQAGGSPDPSASPATGSGRAGSTADSSGDEPVETGAIIETAFEEHDADYEHPEVWWTDLVFPALDALPGIDPPPDAEEYTVELELREVYSEGQRTTLEATDGDRSARFRVADGRVEAVDSDVYAEAGPRWVEFVKERIADTWEQRDWSPETTERETESARR